MSVELMLELARKGHASKNQPKELLATCEAVAEALDRRLAMAYDEGGASFATLYGFWNSPWESQAAGPGGMEGLEHPPHEYVSYGHRSDTYLVHDPELASYCLRRWEKENPEKAAEVKAEADKRDAVGATEDGEAK